MSTEPKAAAAATDGPSQDDRNFAVLAHASGIIASAVGPLVIWQIKKDQSAFVAEHAKEALNFQVTLLAAYLLAFLVYFAIGGVAFLIVVPALLLSLGLSLMGVFAATEGKHFKYVINARLIK